MLCVSLVIKRPYLLKRHFLECPDLVELLFDLGPKTLQWVLGRGDPRGEPEISEISEISEKVGGRVGLHAVR